jgi:polysaccharide pyruvyl transferase CsaB
MKQEEAEFEVIVVDDGSDDNTEGIVAMINDQCPRTDAIKYTRQSNLRQAAARNNGVRHATGEVVIFIDDDIMVQPGWLKAHADFHAAHPEKEAMAVGHITWPPKPKPNRFMRWLEAVGYMPNYKGLSDGDATDFWHFYTGNLSMKKEWFNKLNYDEHFKAYGYEDTKFGYELMQKGARLQYLQGARVYHDSHFEESDYFPDRMRQIGKSATLFDKQIKEISAVPRGLKRLILSFLSMRPIGGLLGLLKREWKWYSQSKRYFLEGIKLADRPHSYLIVGSYGASNIGDEVMLELIIENLTRNSIKYVLSGDVQDTGKRHKSLNDIAPHLPFGLRSLFSFKWLKSFRLIRKADTVLLGGGGLFVDDYRLRAVLLWSWHIFWFWMLKKRIILFANSIGPLKTATGKRLTQWALGKCEKIIVRDPLSEKLAHDIGFQNNVFLGSDLAFLHPAPKASHKEKKVALNLRHWNFRYDTLTSFIDFLIKEGYEVLLIAMEKADEKILRRVSKKDAAVYHPESFKNLCDTLARCELAIGMRLHFLIASMISGCKVAGIAYSKKVEGILNENEIPHLQPELMDEAALRKLINEAKTAERLESSKSKAGQMFRRVGAGL